MYHPGIRLLKLKETLENSQDGPQWGLNRVHQDLYATVTEN